MADSTKGVLEFLEQLRKERDELNVLIAGVEKRLGIAAEAKSTPEDHSAPPPAPTVRVSISSVPVGFFHNLSQAKAAEKILRLNPGQPLTTQDMLAAFRGSGMFLNPKNATTILYTALSRNPRFERVAGKAWGLAEWYPETKKKQEAKRAATVEEKAEEKAAEW
jgi:hypothetical protein